MDLNFLMLAHWYLWVEASGYCVISLSHSCQQHMFVLNTLREFLQNEQIADQYHPQAAKSADLGQSGDQTSWSFSSEFAGLIRL